MSDSRFRDALDAWHGSHADFDEFRDDKINTGEGAQVYGHGHYVGEARGTGETYRDAVARKRLGGRGYYFDRDDDYGPISVGQLLNHHNRGDTRKVERMLHQVADHHGLPYLSGSEYDHLIRILDMAHDQYDDGSGGRGPDPRSMLDYSKDMHEDVLSDGEFDPSDEEHVESKSFLDAYPVLEKWVDAVKESVGGRLYELKLDLSDPHILDWEKPLKDHHPEVITKLNTASPMDVTADNLKNMSAGDFYKSILSGVNGHGSPEAASKALLDSGIYGIRYLDQFSRGYRDPVLELDGNVMDHRAMYWPSPEEAKKDDNARERRYAGILATHAQSGIHGGSVYDGYEGLFNAADYLRRKADRQFFDRGHLDEEHQEARDISEWFDKNHNRLKFEAPKPTYNYVVFDPKLIKMVRKYDDRGNVVHDYTQASGTELRPVDHDPFAEEKK